MGQQVALQEAVVGPKADPSAAVAAVQREALGLPEAAALAAWVGLGLDPAPAKERRRVLREG